MKKLFITAVILTFTLSTGCTIANKIRIKEKPADLRHNEKAEAVVPRVEKEPPAVQTPSAPLEKAMPAPSKASETAAGAKTKSAEKTLPAEKKTDGPEVQQTPIPAPPEDDSQKIALNFDNADIYEVINSLSDILGINYIIDPAVKGKVNIHTSGEISRNQLLPVLETIFDMNNISMVRSGNIYKIVPVKSATGEIVDIQEGRSIDLQSYDRTLVQVIPLQYVSSSEIVKIIKPFISKGGDIVEYKPGNILIIVDTAATINKIVGLINLVDIDSFEHTGIHFFKIENAQVKELAAELETVFTSFGIEKTTEKGIGLKFIPIERVSCILAVSAIPGIFKRVDHWIKILDVVDQGAEEQVFIYFVENGKAEEISDVLMKIYGDLSNAKKSTRTTSPKTRKTPTPKVASGNADTVTFIQGDIKIVTDETTNSIIVRSTPHDYNIIKKTIEKLDMIPKQVLIEVLIAEVTLGDKTKFGVEWALRGDAATIGGYKGQDKTGIGLELGGLGTSLASDLSSGFSYLFDSNRLQAFLLAQADDNRLNILSSPHILAADNKEARIEVGEEVPIVTSEYVPMEQETNTSTSRSIEYRNTGVILTVTPRINDKGLVAMDITQEVSEAGEVSEGGIQSPKISNRKAETSLVVQNGQTIIIGGLIKNQNENSVFGVPVLSKIPGIRLLFSRTTSKETKTELIILITPHVIENLDEADMITNEIREKMDNIKKLIKKGGDNWSQY